MKNYSIKKSNNKKKKGFTLIELMAVIAIVAILAAAFIPKISGFIAESRKVAVLNQASKVLTAYESIKLRSPSNVSESSDIATVCKMSNGMVALTDIDKIASTLTVSNCINILNTENFTFKVGSDGKLTDAATIKLYTALE